MTFQTNCYWQGMYCGKMGHTCTFLKAKSFISKTGMGFFLSVIIQWVQVRLCSVLLVSSAVTKGFQWHREAFQNKLVFVCLLGWYTEQGHICVAKLNLRWSQRRLKRPQISEPIGSSQCPSVWSPCHSPIPQGTLSLFAVLLWSESCSLQLIFGHWSLLSPPQGASVIQGQLLQEGNKTYCGKYAFPGKCSACLQVVKQSLLWVPHIVHVCCFIRLMMSSGVFGSVQGAALEVRPAADFVTTFRSSGALGNSRVSVYPSSKGDWWSDGFINQGVFFGEVDAFILLTFWWHDPLQQQL